MPTSKPLTDFDRYVVTARRLYQQQFDLSAAMDDFDLVHPGQSEGQKEQIFRSAMESVAEATVATASAEERGDIDIVWSAAESGYADIRLNVILAGGIVAVRDVRVDMHQGDMAINLYESAVANMEAIMKNQGDYDVVRIVSLEAIIATNYEAQSPRAMSSRERQQQAREERGEHSD